MSSFDTNPFADPVDVNPFQNYLEDFISYVMQSSLFQ